MTRDTGKENGGNDPLQAFMELSETEKKERGLVHTPREIFQQPQTWAETYLRCREAQVEWSPFLKKSGVGVKKSEATVVLVGAGTSDFVGRSLAPLLRSRWGCEAWAVPSTDLLTNIDNYQTAQRPHLWISFSRSGDSSEGVAVLRRAISQYPAIRHFVVTCNQAGAMAELCRQNPERALALVLDEAVNDRGLAMTSSFSNMVVAGQCLAHLDDLDAYGKIVRYLVDSGSKVLFTAAKQASVLTQLNFSKACFVGSGALAAVAKESALKVLELTAGKIYTMSESALGLRHGPMSAIDGETVFTLFLSDETLRRRYEVDLLREIRHKKLGKAVVAVVPRGCADVQSLADHVISLELPQGFGDEYRPPLDVVFGQLLGLFSSIHAGLEPDHPSPGGVITRVVSHVNIYS